MFVSSSTEGKLEAITTVEPKNVTESLPDDIFFLIFSFLPSRSFSTVSLVAKKWNRIANDEKALKTWLLFSQKNTISRLTKLCKQQAELKLNETLCCCFSYSLMHDRQFAFINFFEPDVITWLSLDDSPCGTLGIYSSSKKVLESVKLTKDFKKVCKYGASQLAFFCRYCWTAELFLFDVHKQEKKLINGIIADECLFLTSFDEVLFGVFLSNQPGRPEFGLNCYFIDPKNNKHTHWSFFKYEKDHALNFACNKDYFVYANNDLISIYSFTKTQSIAFRVGVVDPLHIESSTLFFGKYRDNRLFDFCAYNLINNSFFGSKRFTVLNDFKNSTFITIFKNFIIHKTDNYMEITSYKKLKSTISIYNSKRLVTDTHGNSFEKIGKLELPGVIFKLHIFSADLIVMHRGYKENFSARGSLTHVLETYSIQDLIAKTEKRKRN